jgi:putative ABC transport system ATP-binding protein
MAILQDLNAQGITVVIVTHDARVARHAQRVVHIRDGEVVLNEMVEDRIMARSEIRSMDSDVRASHDDSGLSVNESRHV